MPICRLANITAAALLAIVSVTSTLHAQNANRPPNRIPPAGVKVSDADQKELQAGVDQLGSEIDSLRDALKKQPALLDLLPDVQIYHNAVRYALTYNEFFKADEVAKAKVLLKEGLARSAELKDGKPSWIHASGLVVRGYASKIDGSIQPYGLVLPPSVAEDSERPRRLDLWYHGRGETLSEINFISERERSKGDFTPADTIVLHPYGRYCNANRFAGEVDTFEAARPMPKNTTASIPIASACAASRWAARPSGCSRRTIPISGWSPRPARDLARLPTSCTSGIWARFPGISRPSGINTTAPTWRSMC